MKLVMVLIIAILWISNHSHECVLEKKLNSWRWLSLKGNISPEQILDITKILGNK